MTVGMKFETKRLNVESWSLALCSDESRDALAAELSFILTPAVLQHLPTSLHVSDTEGAMCDWIDAREAESEVLTIRDGDATLSGLLILANVSGPDGNPSVHIGYLLSENVWGKGYATELIAGLVAWYRDHAAGIPLYAGIETGNTASAKVLHKNGFERVDDHSDPDNAMFRLNSSAHSATSTTETYAEPS